MNLQIPLLLSGSLNTACMVFSDLLAAVVFGLLIGVAGTLYWHSRKVAAMQNASASALVSLDAESGKLRESLLESETARTFLQQEKEQLLQKISDAEKTPATIPVQMVEARKDQEQTFFMSQPNRNGKFPESGRHSDTEKAIYKFQVNSGNPSVASFEFVAKDVYLQVALGNEPTWINTACERNNTPGDRTTQAKTLSPGLAVLHGDEWEITRKAKITYL